MLEQLSFIPIDSAIDSGWLVGYAYTTFAGYPWDEKTGGSHLWNGQHLLLKKSA
jgi:hypothetical protein